MDIFHNIALGLPYVMDPFVLMILVIGCFVGIVIGAIPGLSATMAVSLAIPVSFSMDTMPALALLISVWVGALTGGLISACLLGIPGTPASVMTTFDGYPLAQRNPGKALGYGITASFLGGGFSYLVLFTVAPLCADLAVKLGNFEIFSLVMCAMVMMADSDEGNFVRALMAGFAGIFVSCVGIDQVDGTLRFTYDSLSLSTGFDLTALMLGLFALPQLIDEVQRLDKVIPNFSLKFKDILPCWKDIKESAVNILRSSFIGTFIGILPGAGGVTATVVAYNQAKNSSTHPETFGKGERDGIVASESANNAVSGGAMIPMLSLGIPGCPVAAIMLSGLIVKDIQPGPALFVSNPGLVFGFFLAFFIANIIIFCLMMGLLKPFALVMKIRMCYLIPVILTLCVIGSYATKNNMNVVWVMFCFGLAAYLMRHFHFPLGSFVLGVVLGPLAEVNLREGLSNSFGDYSPLLTRPMSLCFLLLALVFFCWPRIRRWCEARKANTTV